MKLGGKDNYMRKARKKGSEWWVGWVCWVWWVESGCTWGIFRNSAREGGVKGEIRGVKCKV